MGAGPGKGLPGRQGAGRRYCPAEERSSGWSNINFEGGRRGTHEEDDKDEERRVMLQVYLFYGLMYELLYLIYANQTRVPGTITALRANKPNCDCYFTY